MTSDSVEKLNITEIGGASAPDALQDPEEGRFVRSLEGLRVEDVAPGEAQKPTEQKGFDVFSAVRIVLLCVCLGIFVYCGWQLITIFESYQRGDTYYDGLADDFHRMLEADENGPVSPLGRLFSDRPMNGYGREEETGGEAPVQREYSLRFQRLRVYLGNLAQSNDETYGFISVDGTKIAYPVVQAEDNQYYLTHSFDRTPLKAGSIYVDFRNDPVVEKNRNLVIYGHNMQNGAMFHDLTKYLDEDFFMTNGVEIATMDGIYRFQVFAVYAVNKYEPYYSTFFTNDDAFVDFCRQVEQRSLFHRSDVSFSPDDVILTMTTCVTGDLNSRYAIHAKLIGIDT